MRERTSFESRNLLSRIYVGILVKCKPETRFAFMEFGGFAFFTILLPHFWKLLRQAVQVKLLVLYLMSDIALFVIFWSWSIVWKVFLEIIFKPFLGLERFIVIFPFM